MTYVGDVEEIEDHIRRSKNGKEYNSSIVPDICDKKGHFDAVANLRGEMFIFKGKVKISMKTVFNLRSNLRPTIGTYF